mgnify:CR=1 FL=1
MSIDADLETFFSQDIQQVVDDPDRFRMKLNIGIAAFKYLSNAQNLGAFASAISAGAAVAGVAFASWWASLGVLGTLGVTFGIMSTPVGWFAAAGVGGASLTYYAKKVFGSAKEAAITEVPKFINTPLDLLAISIFDLISPILLKIAYSDSEICNQERQKIHDYFVSEWGFNPRYIDGVLAFDLTKFDGFDWDRVPVLLSTLEASGDIRYQTIADEIVRIAKAVAHSDGIVSSGEELELQNLKRVLKYRG